MSTTNDFGHHSLSRPLISFLLHPSVTEVTTSSDNNYKLSGTGYFESGQLFLNDKVLTRCPEDLAVIAKIGYLCNNSQITDREMFGNPTDGALLALSQKLNIAIEDTARLEELPFTHERKWMGVKCVSKSTVTAF